MSSRSLPRIGAPSFAGKVLLVAAGAALLAGMWAGLLRLGTGWPVLHPALPMSHGPLMVGGFLGTLICLERAVAFGGRAALLPPAATAAGALMVVFRAGGWAGPLLMAMGSAGLAVVMVALWNRHRTAYGAVLVAGAISWLGGNLLWLSGRSVPSVVLWWMGFVVLTIAGERLELSRLLRLSTFVQRLFVACAALLALGLLVSVVDLALGTRIAGAGMLAFALWLLRYDIAWRRLRAGGQARFVAICLLSGYVWLAVSGLLAMRYGGVMAGPSYDAMLHALFVGFAFSMIFGHAPIVFPAILHIPLAHRPRFYVHLLLLHITLLLRVAGDLALVWPLRTWGGVLNVVVILLFVANTLTAVLQSRHSERSPLRQAADA